MGRSRLRRFLARAVILGIGATQSGCCCSGDGPEVDVAFDRSEPDISARIDRCQANRNDCEALCRSALDAVFGEEAQYYGILDCDVTPTVEGARVKVLYETGAACGRAPSGLLACELDAKDPVVHWLAQAAYLEAASVVAFAHLAADLVVHRAPRRLIEAAIVAARDEIRHAAMLHALIGGRVHVPLPRVAAYRPASLRELAMHNAVEGCAREMIGATVNLWQAQRARDPQIRAVFASIANDECAHAELSWEIHAWALGQLDAEDAIAIADAQHDALASFVDNIAVDAAARDVLGLPTAHELRILANAIS